MCRGDPLPTIAISNSRCARTVGGPRKAGPAAHRVAPWPINQVALLYSAHKDTCFVSVNACKDAHTGENLDIYKISVSPTVDSLLLLNFFWIFRSVRSSFPICLVLFGAVCLLLFCFSSPFRTVRCSFAGSSFRAVRSSFSDSSIDFERFAPVSPSLYGPCRTVRFVSQVL